MSQKTVTIILSILAALIMILFGAAFLLSRDRGVSPGEVLRDFLPFGKSGEENIPRTPEALPKDGEEERGPGEVVQPKETSILDLRKIQARPVAGARLNTGTTGNTIQLHYVEQDTGNIFSVLPKVAGIERLTLTTIPEIQEVVWGKDSLVMRYLDENNVIKSYEAKFSQTKETGGALEELKGVFFPDDISQMRASPGGTQVFYLAPSGNATVGTIANFDGNSKRQVFNLRQGEWLPEWESPETITLTRKASAKVLGFAYFLNTQSGALQRVLGSVYGLTTKTSPDTKMVLAGESVSGAYKAFTHKVGGEGRTPFPIGTFPEKCVWSKLAGGVLYCGAPEEFPVSNYPDDWYSGVISFSDSLWRVDSSTGAVELLSVPQNRVREEVDLINPFLSKDESYLFFTNKKDSSLWSLRLK